MTIIRRFTKPIPPLLVLLAACELPDETDDELAETASEITVLGTYVVSGQTLEVAEIGAIHNDTQRIASCGNGVLYATRSDRTLWWNKSGGAGAWTQIDTIVPGTKIACDRRHLYSLSAGGYMYHASTTVHGELDEGSGLAWKLSVGGKALTVPAGTDDIQSGLGNIYAIDHDYTTGVAKLWASELKDATSADGYVQASEGSWTLLAGNLGTNLATGAGSRKHYTSITTSLPYRKTNRAFGANPDETLYYNDTLLDGQNLWTSFPNAGAVLHSITADDSNTLYALATGPWGRRILRYEFTERSCTDGKDNDANGQTDAEDPACRQRLAQSWCASRTGRYCIDRIENTNGYSHALVTCGSTVKIQDGLCTKSSLAGYDYLTPARANNEIYDAGHYCNVHNADGTWDFAYEGATPCDTLLDRHPGATIVRAGIYAKSGPNAVYVRCNNGAYVPPEGNGTTPLEQAMDAVGHTANRCVVTVSPRQMRVFNAPFPTSAWSSTLYGGRGYRVGHVYDHVPQCEANDPGCPCGTQDCSVGLSQFGNGESGSSSRINTHGKAVTTSFDNQSSYDFVMNEGTPLRSLGWGTVVSSRDRDLTSISSGEDCANGAICGTTYQGEIHVRYDIGDDPTYAESFVAYYAHVGRRVVTTGQTVAPGQLLGYVGTTGASSDPHVHFGLLRLTNTNLRTPVEGEQFGYQADFRTANSGSGIRTELLGGEVDPYGWRAPAGIDPNGHMWGNAAAPGNATGRGAWSPILWMSSETPPYGP